MSKPDTTGTPGRSSLTTETARLLLKESFGIDGELSTLPSYWDQNFRVRTLKDSYVFKISNSLEDLDLLAAQAEALACLQRDGLPVPHLIADESGAHMVTRVVDGSTHALRLVSFMPGDPMAGINPMTNNLAFDLGVVLGQMDLSLVSFDAPSLHRAFEWDLPTAAETIRSRTHLVTNTDQADLLNSFVAYFKSTVVDKLQFIPHQVIHGDANDHNVLVTSDPGHRKIAGLIDFGDLMYSVRIAEIATAAAYVMMDAGDPVGMACSLVAGYHGTNPILEEELDVLEGLILARLCISVSVCAEQKLKEPENDYIRVSERPAWDLLFALRELPDRLATYRFRQACGYEPYPGNEQLVTWLTSHASSFSPLLSQDLRLSPSLVFDFSVGTLDWKPDDMMKPLVAGIRMNRMMEDAGVPVGVGRYDEPRLVYAGEQFSSKTIEKRTVHIGLDLFQEPGCPVYAPLDGVVFSAGNRKIQYDYGPVIVLRHTPIDGPEFFTLYGHLSAASVENLRPGDRVKSGAEVGHIGTRDENGGWIPHLHFQVIGDMLGSTGDCIGVALASQRDVWKSICPDPNIIVGIPAEYFPAPGLSKDQILAKRSEHSGPSLSLSYKRPLHIIRGYMQHLYEPDGTAYLDAVNNVPHVGHAHPRVVEALSRQMRALNTNTRYLHENLVNYSERLAATMPDSLSVVYLVNSGSEANDLALRMARLVTGGKDVITVDGAYHGNLSSLIDVSPYKHDGPGGEGAPDSTLVVPMPDPYRGKHRGHNAESGAAYAMYVHEAASRATNAGGLAAFICESALGCGGQVFLPESYLKHSFKSVREHGGVCIADEVQVGMGRLGTHFWGFESHNVVPDIVTIGKPIGNGHPLGAVVTTRRIADAFNNGMEYFNTFGGNPASCAVGLAVLDVLRDENLQDSALRVGSHLFAGLSNLSGHHNIIGDVRGQGLFLGIELVKDRESLEPAAAETSYAVNRLRDHGILTSTDGPLNNVIKIKPPMVFSTDDADRLAATLDHILQEDFLRYN